MSGPGAEEPRLPCSSGSTSGWSGKEALVQPGALFRKPRCQKHLQTETQRKQSQPTHKTPETPKEEPKVPQSPNVSRALPLIPSFA